MLTRQYHWDAEKAGHSRADQSQSASPSSTQQLRVHHEHADDVCWDFQQSGDKRIDVNITVERSGI